MTTNPTLERALACAERGWPVFPCQPGRKTPATPHGYLDATTDPARIREWFGRRPDLNLAVATGAPGPDILDIDQHDGAGDGFQALGDLRAAGLLDGIVASVRTPSAGLHLYLTGSAQRSAHLPARHVDFLAQGGYALIPPSEVDGRPYTQLNTIAAANGLDWAAARQVLELTDDNWHPTPPAASASAHPARAHRRPGPLGCRPPGRQPQQRAVLGRQPRPRSRPGRRPQPPGRRRPPGRPRRIRDHPNPGLRPPHHPGPPRTARPPGRRRALT